MSGASHGSFGRRAEQSKTALLVETTFVPRDDSGRVALVAARSLYLIRRAPPDWQQRTMIGGSWVRHAGQHLPHLRGVSKGNPLVDPCPAGCGRG